MQPHILTSFQSQLVNFHAFRMAERRDGFELTAVAEDVKDEMLEDCLICNSNEHNANDGEFGEERDHNNNSCERETRKQGSAQAEYIRINDMKPENLVRSPRDGPRSD